MLIVYEHVTHMDGIFSALLVITHSHERQQQKLQQHRHRHPRQLAGNESKQQQTNWKFVKYLEIYEDKT